MLVIFSSHCLEPLAVNAEFERTAFLRYEQDGNITFWGRWGNMVSPKLFSIFYVLHLACFRTDAIRCIFKEKALLVQIDPMLGDLIPSRVHIPYLLMVSEWSFDLLMVTLQRNDHYSFRRY